MKPTTTTKGEIASWWRKNVVGWIMDRGPAPGAWVSPEVGGRERGVPCGREIYVSVGRKRDVGSVVGSRRRIYPTVNHVMHHGGGWGRSIDGRYPAAVPALDPDVLPTAMWESRRLDAKWKSPDFGRNVLTREVAMVQMEWLKMWGIGKSSDTMLKTLSSAYINDTSKR